MSSDLFAAFGSPALPSNENNIITISEEPSRSAELPLSSGSGDVNGLTIDNGDDDDDFGDFEDASAPIVAGPAQDRASVAQAAVIGHSITKKKPLPFSAPPPKQDQPQVGRHPFADHMDLLFSADDDNDEYNAGADEMMDLATNPEAAMEYSKRIIAQQQAEREDQEKARAALILQAIDSPTVHADTRSSPLIDSNQTETGKAARNPNVLFDADDPSDVEDDDFGDFEAGGTLQTTQPEFVSQQIRADHLLALDDESIAPLHGASKQQIRSLPDRRKTPQVESESQTSRPHEPNPEIFNDDAWDDFEDGPQSVKQVAPSAKPPEKQLNPSAAITPAPSKARAETGLPPTNIPPPSILLSIFPRIFTQANEALLTPLSKASPHERQILISHPASRKFLSKYLVANIVLGHVIAGRKLRWKRDQYLAQGMRIGPAAAGGKGGMKLAGVDKSEVAREDREVLDVVRAWKAQVGKARSAVTALNATKFSGVNPKVPAMPDIAETLPVKVLKATEGGFSAPHACALCGLKREERVAKVDMDVDDSFGEWWVSSMSMHLTCKNFWQEHEALLRSR